MYIRAGSGSVVGQHPEATCRVKDWLFFPCGHWSSPEAGTSITVIASQQRDSTPAFSRAKVKRRQTFTDEAQRLTAGNLEQYRGNNDVFTSNNPDNPRLYHPLIHPHTRH